MTAYTFQQFVAESFAKMDSQIHDLMDRGESTEIILSTALGNLQGILDHLAKRIDELALPT